MTGGSYPYSPHLPALKNESFPQRNLAGGKWSWQKENKWRVVSLQLFVPATFAYVLMITDVAISLLSRSLCLFVFTIQIDAVVDEISKLHKHLEGV